MNILGWVMWGAVLAYAVLGSFFFKNELKKGVMLQPQTIGIILNCGFWSHGLSGFRSSISCIPWLVLLFWLCTLPITVFAAYAGLWATPAKGKWWILILTISVNVLVLGALTSLLISMCPKCVHPLNSCELLPG